MNPPNFFERSFDDFEHSATGLPDAWPRNACQSPAFQRFAKRIGVVDCWKKNRWPNLCSPTPENGPDVFTSR
jgi:hypothetical protein